MLVQPGRILVGQRSSVRAFYPGVPDVFGAPIGPGEGQEETLVWELGEELGITPSQGTYLETEAVYAEVGNKNVADREDDACQNNWFGEGFQSSRNATGGLQRRAIRWRP